MHNNSIMQLKQEIQARKHQVQALQARRDASMHDAAQHMLQLGQVGLDSKIK